jgi:hypothetical protein
MDEKKYLSKLEKIQAELDNFSDDAIVDYINRKGFDRFVNKITRLAQKHAKLRASYTGDVSFNAENIDYGIEARMHDIDRLLNEIQPAEMLATPAKIPPPIPKKSEEVKQRYKEITTKPAKPAKPAKIPPPIPKKSEEVKQKYKELMTKRIVIRESPICEQCGK